MTSHHVNEVRWTRALSASGMPRAIERAYHWPVYDGRAAIAGMPRRVGCGADSGPSPRGAESRRAHPGDLRPSPRRRARGRCGRRPGSQAVTAAAVPHSRSPGARRRAPPAGTTCGTGPSRSGRSSAVKAASSSRARSAQAVRGVLGEADARGRGRCAPRATPAASAALDARTRARPPTSRTTSPYCGVRVHVGRAAARCASARAPRRAPRPRPPSPGRRRRPLTSLTITAPASRAARGHLGLVGVDRDRARAAAWRSAATTGSTRRRSLLGRRPAPRRAASTRRRRR